MWSRRWLGARCRRWERFEAGGFSTFFLSVVISATVHAWDIAKERVRGWLDTVHEYLSYYSMLFLAEDVAEPVPQHFFARITTFIAGLRVSSAIVRPVILDSIIETLPFSLRWTCADNFEDSYPYRGVHMTDTFKRRRGRPFGSLEAVRSRLRPAYFTRLLQSDG